MPPEPPPPPTAPVPVAATISIATSAVVVTFDQALVPGVSNVFNWSGRADVGAGSQAWNPAGPLAIAGSTVSGVAVLAAPNPGPDVVNYTAFLPDVVGLVGGLPAPAFANFPLAVIP